jgi:hypothetical protein
LFNTLKRRILNRLAWAFALTGIAAGLYSGEHQQQG